MDKNKREVLAEYSNLDKEVTELLEFMYENIPNDLRKRIELAAEYQQPKSSSDITWSSEGARNADKE